MKNARQQRILELIEEYDIDTQDTLIKKLSESGFDVTQTTISRDIRQLNLVKSVNSKGEYKYVAPGVGMRAEGAVPVLGSSITDSVLKIAPAGNIVVIKTYAGMANAIAVCIDGLRLSGIVGSVAGDDTMLLVVKNNEMAGKIEAELKEIFHI